ncbi:hypothetical protein AcW1_002938 [Taiwanofungus camphoratus]|nr:hypothetical protein AcV5_001876 [Antrodia cinnamomea]KAI0925392.1 hypothetical protein AcV7_005650 [Antrodia cinnamomea]KAI0942262.1 hypothetical protein AcW1_002938 [Antrodia cinnamomea]
MANWVDFLSLTVTLSLIAGVTFGLLYIVKKVSEAVQATKASLKNKGVNISSNGMHVKTSRRLNREDYMDATQRGLLKALHNSMYGPGRPPTPESLHAKGSEMAARELGSSAEDREKGRHLHSSSIKKNAK